MKKSSKCYMAESALAAAIFTLAGGLASAEEQKADARLGQPSLIVVRTSAQWCAVCAFAKTSFAKLKGQLSDESILFVMLDRTDEASTRQAVYLAKALGIDEALADGLGRVGTVVIVNTQSKRVIGMAQLSPNVATVAQAIKKALASVS